MLGLREVRTGHAIVLVGGLYWSNWLHRRSHGAEVYIVHAATDGERAQVLLGELEARGLWVEARAGVDDERHERLLHGAEVVIALDLESSEAGEALIEQIRCGGRSRYSVAFVPAGVDAAWVMEFVKRAPSLLPMEEVWTCSELLICRWRRTAVRLADALGRGQPC